MVQHELLVYVEYYSSQISISMVKCKCKKIFDLFGRMDNSLKLGVDNMSIKETNIALLSTLPEKAQQQIYVYLTTNFCDDNPFKPKTADEIYNKLAESRACYERGEFEDFDDALNEISEKYGL